LHHSTGEEIFSSSSLIGDAERSDGTLMNPDSTLRQWPLRDHNDEIIINPKTENPYYNYTNTTAAGLFYSVDNLTDDQKKNRLYKEKFKGRVLPISSKIINPETGE